MKVIEMIKLISMTILLFLSGASMAQKVVDKADAGDKAIIDSREMPAKAITESKKPRNVVDGIATAATNKTISYYFEVMKTDLNNGASINWLTAIQNCEKYNSGDDKEEWRLPTQRELMLIWALHVSLINKVTDFVSFSNQDYWSATEYTASTSSSWSVKFYDGYTFYGNNKLSKMSLVRCVRDLTPPTP